ncbi:MAG: DUF4173 domain-containing protein [Pyrinomonadaceae bacterium]|nr:DUF4173 domain-containing protein [Pyrinomonadaceae bacterium]
MNDKTKTGIEILQTAILLGITGDMLLRATPWGLNVFLWVSLLVAAMVAITFRRRREHWTPQTMALHGGLVFFSLMYVWRDSLELQILDFLAIITILGLLILPSLNMKIHIAGVFHYMAALCWSGISLAFAPFLLLVEDIKWKTIPSTGFSKHLVSVLKGLAIAAPILLVFGALFMAADAVFQGIIEKTFNINLEVITTHVVVISIITWMVAGYLRSSMFKLSPISSGPAADAKSAAMKDQVPSVTMHVSEDPAGNDEKAKKEEAEVKKEKTSTWQDFNNSFLPGFFTLGAVETAIVLGLINLLFLSFVIIQIPYLFGGIEIVQSTPDFKLAEYARRGFGELVLVAALVLPILLGAHWLLRKDNPMNERLYRILAAIQIGLLFVIMISAAQRMLLYTGNMGYGLTAERLYPMVFMIWLAMVFTWFLMTVLRGMRSQFAWGALWSGLFLLGTLHVLNPDDFIVRTNIRLMQEGRAFDGYANTRLSDDSVPVLLDSMELMSANQRCTVKRKLSRRLAESHQEMDFRSWNYSRWVASSRLAENRPLLDMSTCAEEFGSRFRQRELFHR